jgi:hypothetical protein
MTNPGGTAPPQQREPRDTAVLDGVLERVTFANPETGYTIARIAPDRGKGRIAKEAPESNAAAGEEWEIEGPGDGLRQVRLWSSQHNPFERHRPRIGDPLELRGSLAAKRRNQQLLARRARSSLERPAGRPSLTSPSRTSAAASPAPAPPTPAGQHPLIGPGTTCMRSDGRRHRAR